MQFAGGRGVPLKKMAAHIGPNTTPMVDVVMCILIFFMLGSSLVTQELFLQSAMPAIDKGGLGAQQGNIKLPAVRMNIVMTRHKTAGGGETWVSAFNTTPQRMDKIDDRDQSSNEKIAAFLDQRKKTFSDDVQIIIVPDELVPYQDVITIYNDCMKAKFKQVAFAPARPAEQ